MHASARLLARLDAQVVLVEVGRASHFFLGQITDSNSNVVHSSARGCLCFETIALRLQVRGLKQRISIADRNPAVRDPALSEKLLRKNREAEMELLRLYQVRKRMSLHAAAGIGASAFVVLFAIPNRDKNTPNYLLTASQAQIHLPC